MVGNEGRFLLQWRCYQSRFPSTKLLWMLVDPKRKHSFFFLEGFLWEGGKALYQFWENMDTRYTKAQLDVISDAEIGTKSIEFSIQGTETVRGSTVDKFPTSAVPWRLDKAVRHLPIFFLNSKLTLLHSPFDAWDATLQIRVPGFLC